MNRALVVALVVLGTLSVACRPQAERRQAGSLSYGPLPDASKLRLWTKETTPLS